MVKPILTEKQANKILSHENLRIANLDDEDTWFYSVIANGHVYSVLVTSNWKYTEIK